MFRFAVKSLRFGIAVALLIVSRDAYSVDDKIRAAFSDKVVEHICSDGGEWLRCYTLRPETCTSVSKSIVRPCVDSVLSSVPEVKDQAESRALSQQLMGCFNERFMQFYGAGKLSTPECKSPPAHLQ